MKDLIEKTCSKFSIQLRDLNIPGALSSYLELTGLTDEDRFIDRSYCIGDDQIILGVYEDEELRLVHFFHKLGHIRLPRLRNSYQSEDKCEQEALCWEYAFRVARWLGAEVSDSIKDDCLEALMSYHVTVEVDLPDDVLLGLAMMAHEQDITLNELCNNILREIVETDGKCLGLDCKHDWDCSEETPECNKCGQQGNVN